MVVSMSLGRVMKVGVSWIVSVGDGSSTSLGGVMKGCGSGRVCGWDYEVVVFLCI